MMNSFASLRTWRSLLAASLAAGVLLGLSGIFGPTASAFAALPGVEIVQPRCEYLDNPLGIDVVRPRLSWKLKAIDADARGERQTAYRILVAGSEAALTADRGDLWDSGEVASSESAHVVYAGHPLRSGMACFWKVRACDPHGVWSTWSKPARWTMGLLGAGDWSAQWIGTDAIHVRRRGWPIPDNTMPDPWLRKQFTLAAAPVRAMLTVASVGYHEVYVNGRKAGDAVLAPCATNHRKRARYCTYDITKLLAAGPNVIGLWLGTSWSIFPHYKTADKPASPLVLAQADVELAGGARVRVATDATWRTHPSPNTLLGVWDFMYYGGELYDARLELPEWSSAKLDDAKWKPATVFHPKLELSAQQVEPNRPVQSVSPLAIDRVGNGEFRVDMGVNFAGWVELDLHGKPGDRIDMQFSEREEERMTHMLHSAYVIGLTGKGTFHNRFNYSVGRWIQICGLDHMPQLKDIRGTMVRTDYRRTGQFHCSNPLLNKIYDTTLWTFENLTLGGYVVDCPQRERMGYGGDAHATIPTGLTNYDLGAFYTKWSQDWRDAQAEDGSLPYTAPTYWGGGGPVWCGFCITLPWEVYRRYDDRRILEENFPTMERWLAFLETHARGDMLARWGGEWDFLGDWLWPGAKGVNGDTRDTLFFNNCYWIYNLETAARVADVLGRGPAAAAYRRRADAVRTAVHRTFFDPRVRTYVSGMPAYVAMALLVDLPPEEVRPAVWKQLEEEILVHRKGHIHAGITGGAMLFKSLGTFDRQDLILPMVLKQSYPGWGYMFRRGATTVWESWEGEQSLLHSSYLFVGSWFHEGIAGIRPSPDMPGFRQFIIKPGVAAAPSVHWARASYDSIYGPISSQWRLGSGKFRLKVSVPPGTSAIVYLPAKDLKTVTEGRRGLASAEGVKRLRVEGGCVVVQVESGNYAFETEY